MQVPIDKAHEFFSGLQASIVQGLEAEEGANFGRDPWQRAEGGGGLACYIEDGKVFERAGVLFSHVRGSALPPTATERRPELAGRSWEAMGVSMVLHPRNPYVPTTHMNVRLFVAHGSQGDDIFWFGGGLDLTPYYPNKDEVIHFHQICHDAVTPFGANKYAEYKQWCDKYFLLKHRDETRGVGGLFFDDLNQPDFETCFALTKAVGNCFLPAYIPLVQSNKDRTYGQRERDFQAYRRGRYVEFNLVYDRGTHFGLQSGGRTESILLSMPPSANWRYDWQPKPGTAEAKLYEYLKPQEWL